MAKTFFNKLTLAVQNNNSLLCVGLDPEPRKYPDYFPADIDTATLVNWGNDIIEQTADLVCCYKPNIAFYEQYGAAGLQALRQIIAAVPDEIPVLLDAKRGDIGSTAVAYARAAFEAWGADAITLNAYLGRDSIDPFLAYPDKAVFVVCYTSNPSAATIQEFGPPEERLFERVIAQGEIWGQPDRLGYVVGATQPHALARFRELNQTHWILAPGIGVQGGDLAAAISAGLNRQGQGLIIPVSRAITYTDNPRAAAHSLRAAINHARQTNHPPTQPPTQPTPYPPTQPTTYPTNQPPIQPTNQPSIHPPNPHTDLILQLHDVGCVQFGQFTLASGRQSPIYVDLRRMGASARLLKRAALAYAGLLRGLTFDHIAGVPYAALPIGTAVALELGRSLIYPRKEAKAYGTGKTVEGVFEAGQVAVVIEDLVTSGGSALTAIEALEGVGLTVTDVAVLIDRQQGGPQNLAERGYRLHAALTMADILEALRIAGRISTEQAESVKTYLNNLAEPDPNRK